MSIMKACSEFQKDNSIRPIVSDMFLEQAYLVPAALEKTSGSKMEILSYLHMSETSLLSSTTRHSGLIIVGSQVRPPALNDTC